MPPQDDGSDARCEHRDGQTCHGPEPCGPDVGQQPHCDPAADVRGHSVETELVALDVLHHETRLVVAIGKQQSHAYRAERDQSCAFGLKYGQALFTHEPGADPHVQMQPILDDLAFGNALEEQARART